MMSVLFCLSQTRKEGRSQTEGVWKRMPRYKD